MYGIRNLNPNGDRGRETDRKGRRDHRRKRGIAGWGPHALPGAFPSAVPSLSVFCFSFFSFFFFLLRRAIPSNEAPKVILFPP